MQEEDLPLPYLEAIHKRHEEWLVHKTVKSVIFIYSSAHISTVLRTVKALDDTPILVLDCNAEVEKDPVRCKQMLEEVRLASFPALHIDFSCSSASS